MMVKRRFLPAFLVLALACQLSLHAEKTRVAVMDLQVKSGVDVEMAGILGDSLRASIYKADIFELMNREDMVAILDEVKFQMSGACESTSCIVEMGGALGVEKIISGSIGLIGERYSVTIKLVDIATARNDVLITEYYQGKIEELPEFIKGLAQQLVEQAGGRKLKTHSPIQAAIFGLVPGVGQFYNSKPKEAVIFAGLGGVMLVGALTFKAAVDEAQANYDAAGYAADFDYLYDDIERKRLLNQVFIGGAIAVVSWSVIDSYLTGRKIAAQMNVSSDRRHLQLAYALEF